MKQLLFNSLKDGRDGQWPTYGYRVCAVWGRCLVQDQRSVWSRRDRARCCRIWQGQPIQKARSGQPDKVKQVLGKGRTMGGRRTLYAVALEARVNRWRSGTGNVWFGLIEARTDFCTGANRVLSNGSMPGIVAPAHLLRRAIPGKRSDRRRPSSVVGFAIASEVSGSRSRPWGSCVRSFTGELGLIRAFWTVTDAARQGWSGAGDRTDSGRRLDLPPALRGRRR